jgi:hypothetical protein
VADVQDAPAGPVFGEQIEEDAVNASWHAENRAYASGATSTEARRAGLRAGLAVLVSSAREEGERKGSATERERIATALETAPIHKVIAETENDPPRDVHAGWCSGCRAVRIAQRPS